MTEALPKQELLIKLLRMTTSPNDGEALVALRKATQLLDSAGWTWDKLINGKITVIADPFTSIGEPPRAAVREPRRPQAAPRDFGMTPEPPKPQVKTTWPIGKFSNKHPGFCYCCGTEQLAGMANIFKPSDHHPRGSTGWAVVCDVCNTTAIILPNAALPIRKKRGKSVSDLA